MKNRIAILGAVSLLTNLSSYGDLIIRQQMKIVMAKQTISSEATTSLKGVKSRMIVKGVESENTQDLNSEIYNTGTATYSCNARQKMCLKIANGSPFGLLVDKSDGKRVVFKPTGKKDTVAGYECDYYDVERFEPETTSTSHSCYSKSAFALFPKEALDEFRKTVAKMSDASVKKAMLEEVELGVPLKIDTKIQRKRKGGKIETSSHSLLVVSVLDAKLSEGYFELPKGYQIRERADFTAGHRGVAGMPGSGGRKLPPEMLKKLQEMKAKGQIPLEAWKQIEESQK